MPMPGSPLMSTREPLTMPPPSTRSSSERPVWYRCSSAVLISLMGTAWEMPPAGRAPVPRWGRAGSFTASSMVLHSPQPGHFPSHLGDSNPHWLH